MCLTRILPFLQPRPAATVVLPKPLVAIEERHYLCVWNLAPQHSAGFLCLFRTQTPQRVKKKKKERGPGSLWRRRMSSMCSVEFNALKRCPEGVASASRRALRACRDRFRFLRRSSILSGGALVDHGGRSSYPAHFRGSKAMTPSYLRLIRR